MVKTIYTYGFHELFLNYTIVLEDALKNILYFKISEFNPTLSDSHCKLEWEMSASYSLTPTSSEECSMHPIPLRYIWSENSTSAFQGALSSSALQLKIDNFPKKNILIPNVAEII